MKRYLGILLASAVLVPAALSAQQVRTANMNPAQSRAHVEKVKKHHKHKHHKHNPQRTS